MYTEAVYIKFEVVAAAGDDPDNPMVSKTYSYGYDFADGTFFAAESTGRQDESGPGTGALQGGAGAGFGIAESAEFLEAPAYTTDVDIATFSVTAAGNDHPASEDPNADNGIRQLEVSFGPGLGGSILMTEGDGELNKRTPSELVDDIVDAANDAYLNWIMH